MTENYQYNKELSSPGPGIDITNDGFLMRSYIRWNRIANAVICGLYRAPEGVSLGKIRIPVSDGSKIACFVIEPEKKSEKLPVMLFCHGGAFFMPVFKTMLMLGARYAKSVNCRVFIPQYRLSLDHPYPVPLTDCRDTLDYIGNNAKELRADMEKLLIYGDSAGGCLAAETAHICRDRGKWMPKGQLLIYPVTDRSGNYASMEKYRNAVWSAKANQNMWNIYLRNRRTGAKDYAVPMENERFDRLPPAYVEAAEMDCLCDQGLAYAEKMRQAGVPVKTALIPGAYHGYEGNLQSPLVRRVLDSRIKIMKEMLRSDRS